MSEKKVTDFLYEQESYQIRKALFKIWQNFGGAFKEKVIDRALSIELEKQGLTVEDQKQIPIFYEGQKIGIYIPDKIINGKIILELKTKPRLTLGDQRQFWHYLKGSDYKLGFLVNFGAEELEIKRRVYDKARIKNQRQSA